MNDANHQPERALRITLVCPYDPMPDEVQLGHAVVGGVERVFAEVATRLAARGHEVTMLCSTDGPSGHATKSGVRMVREHRSFTVLRAPFCRLARHIPKDADVVHVAATYPFTTPSVLRRAHRMGIPAVLDFHFEPVVASPLGKAAAAAYRQVGPPAYKLADRVLVRSWSYAHAAPSLRGVADAKVRIVPNGIDPVVFHVDGPRKTVPVQPPARTEGSPDAPMQRGAGPDGQATTDYLLFVGRLVPYKGLGVLLDALALEPPGIPLVVVGEGPLRAELEAKANALGVDVRWVGRAADGDLPAWYRGARLTVLPSVNRQEAFGIALVESMACGTPVVATRLKGVEEVARVGGLVAMPCDARDLARQVRHAMHAGLERGRPLMERVHRQFAWDAVTRAIESTYLEVARPSAPSPRPQEVAVADPVGQPLP